MAQSSDSTQRVQFNVDLPFELVRSVRIDVVKHNAKLAGYVEAAFKGFLALKPEERERVLAKHTKRMGRKILQPKPHEPVGIGN